MQQIGPDHCDIQEETEFLQHPKAGIGFPENSWAEAAKVECKDCMEFTAKKAPDNYTSISCNFLLSSTHTDIKEPIHSACLRGHKYFLVFWDEHTSMSTV